MTRAAPSRGKRRAAAAPRRSFVLERNQPLSRSLLWRLQRSFFERRGAQAWTEAVVPHYITSNPWIADAYAKVVLGWLRDLSSPPAAGKRQGPSLDLGRPIHIVELGCGSGRFAYHFLLRFFDLLSRSSVAEVPVRYVLTDFTEHNLEVLRSNVALQPFVEAGLLDFARYDAGADLEISLSQSGEVLAPRRRANPLVVLANYVFDGVPQDCFTLRAGHLYESLVTLSSRQREPDLEDPAVLARLEIAWQQRPAPADPYGEPELDRILAEYAAGLEDTTLVFPAAALRCLRNLKRLAGGRLLLLSADKGYSSESSLAGRPAPGLAVHGSFSLMVNYHAVGRWFAHRGGSFLASSHQSRHLHVVAGLLGAGAWPETRLAFDEAAERRGPDDFFVVKKGIEAIYPSLGLDFLLAWMRLSGWDHNVFLGCLPVLLERVNEASEAEREQVAVATRRIWEAYFPLRESPDLPFCLGMVGVALGRWSEAIEYFEQSLRLHGETPATAMQMAFCQYQLGERAAALQRLDRALAEEPGLEAALELRREIEEASPGAGH